MKSFDASRLRRARASRGMSLDEIARLMSDLIGARITPQHVSRWENGTEPRGVALWAISRALDLPIDCLIADDGKSAFTARTPSRRSLRRKDSHE